MEFERKRSEQLAVMQNACIICVMKESHIPAATTRMIGVRRTKFKRSVAAMSIKGGKQPRLAPRHEG